MLRRLLLLLVVVLVNLPWAHGLLTAHRIDRDGVAVTATVVHTQSDRTGHFVGYRLPRSADAQQRAWSARVDDKAFAQARDTGRLGVRVVPGAPAQNRPDGEVTSPVLGIVAVAVDLLLVGGLLVWWRTRRRRAAATGSE